MTRALVRWAIAAVLLVDGLSAMLWGYISFVLFVGLNGYYSEQVPIWQAAVPGVIVTASGLACLLAALAVVRRWRRAGPLAAVGFVLAILLKCDYVWGALPYHSDAQPTALAVAVWAVSDLIPLVAVLMRCWPVWTRSCSTTRR